MKLYFFEVKPDERFYITEKYPDAVIFEETLSHENVSEISDADIVCVMVHSECSSTILKQLPQLKLLVTRSAGYNHINLKYCDHNNISVCRVPDYGSHVIAEHVFALLLTSVRRILEGEEKTSHGIFDEAGLIGTALKGKTLGVVGIGHIGAHVCRIASCGFLMNVLAFDTHPKKELADEYGFKYVDDINDIYEKSDIITLHAPLLPQTKHMINNESIQKMKDGVTLINTARGGLIDTLALVNAVKEGKFSYVGLDVVEHEDNIKESQELLELPGILITPHVAYYTRESVDNMYYIGFKSIDEFLEGKKLSFKIIGH